LPIETVTWVPLVDAVDDVLDAGLDRLRCNAVRLVQAICFGAAGRPPILLEEQKGLRRRALVA